MEKLVLIIEHTDDCTYSYNDYICFNYESKQKAEEDLSAAIIFAHDLLIENIKEKKLINEKISKLNQKKSKTHYGDELNSINKKIQDLYNDYLKLNEEVSVVFNNKKLDLHDFIENEKLISPNILTLDEWFLSKSI